MRIYQGDSAAVLRALPAASVDMVLTSPPYDNLRTYCGHAAFNFEAIAAELFRVLKPGGVLVWVVGDATVNGSETGTSFRQALAFMGLGFRLHDTMIYEKAGTGACGSNYAYWQSFEYMFVLSKGKPAAVNRLTTEKTVAKGGERVKANGESKPKRTRQNAGIKKSVRSNVWRYAVGAASHDDKVSHPAKFPEALARDHILSWSNPGDVVLDPFAGSGTTLKMAHLSGRKALGIEISREYVDLTAERLRQAGATPTVIYDLPESEMEQWASA